MTTEKVFIALINKQLEKHGVDYNFVLNNPTIEGVEWFKYYTFTEEEFDAYQKWAVRFIKKEMKITNEWAKREFSWFNLGWGLRVLKPSDERTDTISTEMIQSTTNNKN